MKKILRHSRSPRSALLLCALPVLLVGCTTWQLTEGPQVRESPEASPAKVELTEAARAREVAIPQDLVAARRALNDTDPQVRLAGIEALGTVPDADATSELRAIAGRDGELFRAGAITALARRDEWEVVRRGAKDKSWRVRRAAAAALAADESPEGANALGRLLADRSTEVQVEAIRSISVWSLPRAGPLLLAGMESGHYATRVAAHASLAKKWPRATTVLLVDLERLTPPRPSVDVLRAAWEAEYPRAELAARPGTDETPSGASLPAKTPPLDDREELPLLLRRLLHENKHERLAAAERLARGGYEHGTRGLESLTFDIDPEIRRLAAATIGSLQDPFLMATLVRLLDDEPAVRRAAIIGLRQVVGHDVPRDESPLPSNAAEEAERWKAWYARGGFAGRIQTESVP